MPKREKKVRKIEMQVVEHACEGSGEPLADLNEAGEVLELHHPHFVVRVSLAHATGGAPERVTSGETLRISIAEMAKVLTTEQMGELFPGFSFDTDGVGSVTPGKG